MINGYSNLELANIDSATTEEKAKAKELILVGKPCYLSFVIEGEEEKEPDYYIINPSITILLTPKKRTERIFHSETSTTEIKKIVELEGTYYVSWTSNPGLWSARLILDTESGEVTIQRELVVSQM